MKYMTYQVHRSYEPQQATLPGTPQHTYTYLLNFCEGMLWSLLYLARRWAATPPQRPNPGRPTPTLASHPPLTMTPAGTYSQVAGEDWIWTKTLVWGSLDRTIESRPYRLATSVCISTLWVCSLLQDIPSNGGRQSRIPVKCTPKTITGISLIIIKRSTCASAMIDNEAKLPENPVNNNINTNESSYYINDIFCTWNVRLKYNTSLNWEKGDIKEIKKSIVIHISYLTDFRGPIPPQFSQRPSLLLCWFAKIMETAARKPTQPTHFGWSSTLPECFHCTAQCFW